jgi:hypothetical protein
VKTYWAGGYATKRDCVDQCVKDFHALLIGAGSLVTAPCAAAKNPILAKACAIISAGAAAYAFAIPGGCNIACSGNECVTYSSPAVRVRPPNWWEKNVQGKIRCTDCCCDGAMKKAGTP